MKLPPSIAILVTIAVLIVYAPVICPAQDRMDLEDLLEQAVSAYSQVSDYTCLFDRTELVGDRLVVAKNSVFRFKKPKSIYLNMKEGKNKGVVSVYIEGENEGKLIVRPKGVLGVLRIKLDPEGKRAMEDSRHSITDAGIGQILQIVKDNYGRWKSSGLGTVSYLGEVDQPGGSAHAVKAVFPEGAGYYGHVIDIHFDSRSLLPVKISVLDWENRLVEEYEYRDIMLNPNLTDEDFTLDRS